MFIVPTANFFLLGTFRSDFSDLLRGARESSPQLKSTEKKVRKFRHSFELRSDFLEFATELKFPNRTFHVPPQIFLGGPKKGVRRTQKSPQRNLIVRCGLPRTFSRNSSASYNAIYFTLYTKSQKSIFQQTG